VTRLPFPARTRRHGPTTAQELRFAALVPLLCRSVRGAAACMVALLATLAGPGVAAQPPGPPGTVRPNIVFILLDDAGFSDLGSYGAEISTPNLDLIARSGVRFTNFHTASTCEASRVMLMSGVDNHRAGAGTLQVVIAENQKGKPGYEGYLSEQAHSLGQLMRDGGYATYYAGKWNIGDGLARGPGARGWDRYIALEQTGADNYEAKVYAPFNIEPVWWEDGRRAQLPADFYSTRHYVDKMIQYVDEGRAGGKPFFSMIALQAVHSPLQAPKADVDKYLQRYEAGWDRIRSERYQRQVQMGLVPAGLQLPKAMTTRRWDSLSDGQRREYAKRMAVFAGMLDSADQHIGRFREHLRQIGQLDNTVFIVMSDNGADAYDLANLNLPFRIWYRLNYALGYETLGAKGSYVHYGVDWAEVSNTPLALFKGTSGEGGMRVPFIVSYPARVPAGSVTHQFAYATDFLPTVLDMAGIALPGDEYKGRRLHRPTGTSLLPHLEGRTPVIHAPGEAIGYESTGGQALFMGEHKLMRNAGPLGDDRWHLYRLDHDPVEANDLYAREPGLASAMRAEVERYNANNGVVLPEPGYDAFRQLLANNWQVLLRQLGGIAAVVLAVFAGLVYGLLRWWRRGLRRRRNA
jgi:arylsulfatase A-like enzyme